MTQMPRQMLVASARCCAVETPHRNTPAAQPPHSLPPANSLCRRCPPRRVPSRPPPWTRNLTAVEGPGLLVHRRHHHHHRHLHINKNNTTTTTTSCFSHSRRNSGRNTWYVACPIGEMGNPPTTVRSLLLCAGGMESCSEGSTVAARRPPLDPRMFCWHVARELWTLDRVVVLVKPQTGFGEAPVAVTSSIFLLSL